MSKKKTSKWVANFKNSSNSCIFWFELFQKLPFELGLHFDFDLFSLTLLSLFFFISHYLVCFCFDYLGFVKSRFTLSLIFGYDYLIFLFWIIKSLIFSLFSLWNRLSHYHYYLFMFFSSTSNWCSEKFL